MFANIKNKLNKKTTILLVLIILVAIFFRVWNMNSFDISGDNSLNSFRALGWVDFIQGEGQTGPMQWFGKTPAWAKWSFQDAPPLVFAIQHVSFSLFGDSTFAARLPFVIAGVLTVLVIFSAGVWAS
jgi:4-amino-4-deoxy-L-arabinose transferase-like glycosyltransferase